MLAIQEVAVFLQTDRSADHNFVRLDLNNLSLRSICHGWGTHRNSAIRIVEYHLNVC